MVGERLVFKPQLAPVALPSSSRTFDWRTPPYGVTTGDTARRNERLKLPATWLNNFSIANAVAGFIAPLVSGTSIPSSAHVLVVFVWIGLAAGIHCVGQFVLEGMTCQHRTSGIDSSFWCSLP